MQQGDPDWVVGTEITRLDPRRQVLTERWYALRDPIDGALDALSVS